ncbi:hypothetical protein H257_13709 [Aphanomyces astaci]|uniref:Uncharacterized protein n=1 Tax=Aphanomyces astaci TaxID=112090 RepID=W4FVJ8_APHAT|nr:hypothetical protein H257_13709 [Aphanomyces astaci]ETV70976.1 hypothetical protein H257_13709 [Aphanomyces astaci]|eukprot:XP_009839639.1 hypothetical protein H257_13709 [Aphanomyces astaci]
MSPNNSISHVLPFVSSTSMAKSNGCTGKRRILSAWGSPFGLSRQKCHPAPSSLPACCEKRRQNTTSLGNLDLSPHDQPPSQAAVLYKFVNRRLLRKQTAIVGGQRVPYFPVHNAHHRIARSKGSVLACIDEDTDICDTCHNHQLQLTPAIVSMTAY